MRPKSSLPSAIEVYRPTSPVRSKELIVAEVHIWFEQCATFRSRFVAS
jgi:hypothetical protein